MTADQALLIRRDDTVREALAQIDRNRRGIVLVVDGEERITATITDGDVRRALLGKLTMENTVGQLLASRDTVKGPPLTAHREVSRAVALQLMKEHSVRHLPLIDEDGRFVQLLLLEDLVPAELSLHAVIMAGGTGTRLRPLTETLPKPMLPVGDRPLMEHIVDQLRHAGIRQVNVATRYKKEKIVEHFGDGKDFGVDLHYVTEDQPLGTAGALGLIPKGAEPLLVINGDILTKLDFRSMLDFHRHYGADLTVAVRQYDLPVPYGVVETEGAVVKGIVEKPVYSFFVNAGIYLLEPSAQLAIPKETVFHMTDLISSLLKAGRKVVSFPVVEYWMDIGQHPDYVQAQEDVVQGLLAR